MATETAQTQETSRLPQLTVISRVASIPLVASSLTTLHETLSSNAYTSKPYSTASSLSKSALGYTEPIQQRLAPLIVRADGYANLGLDAVESRYPYPFKTPTEEIVKDLKGHSDHAKDVANKTIDEKVVAPASAVVQGIDQRFAPIVDIFESAVHRFQSSHASTSTSPTEPSSPSSSTTSVTTTTSDAKYQYQRAFLLSKDLSDQLRTYSAEQIAQLRTQNALVKRASETAHDLGQLASTSYGTTQVRVHDLSDTMLAELQRVQAATAALPSAIQAALHDISSTLSSTIHDLSVILTAPEPLSEKVSKVRETVQERVHPLLEAATVRVQEILGAVRRSKVGEKIAEVSAEVVEKVPEGVTVQIEVEQNGNGHA